MAASAMYRVHGLLVGSDVELPIRAETMAAPRNSAYVVFMSAATGQITSPVVHTRGGADQATWAIERWHDDGTISVEFAVGVTFQLTRTEVRVVLDHVGDPDLVSHLLLDHVLPRVVALRGDLMLHASGAVGPSGRAHLFLGTTGAGKSTLATWLAGHGWSLLDDDGIRIIGDSTTTLAVPGYAGVRLLPDSAAAVLPDVTPGPPMARGHAKCRFDVADAGLRFAAGPAPVAAVHIVERRDVATPVADPISFAESIGAIAEHAFHLAAQPERATQQAFERTASLAQACTTGRLLVPSGIDRLGLVLELLEQLDARLPVS